MGLPAPGLKQVLPACEERRRQKVSVARSALRHRYVDQLRVLSRRLFCLDNIYHIYGLQDYVPDASLLAVEDSQAAISDAISSLHFLQFAFDYV